MRIGLNLLFMLPTVGGTRTYALSLLEELAEVDNNNDYYIFLNEESKGVSIPLSDHFNKVVLPVWAESRIKRYAYEQFMMPRIVNDYSIDVLHSMGYVSPFKVSCASIATIHDVNYKMMPDEMGLMHRIVLGYFVPQTAKRVDHIITISEFSKNQIVEYLGVPESKITVIHNAAKFHSQSLGTTEAYDQLYKKPFLLVLSSSSPHKNILGAVKTVSELYERGYKDLWLVVAGSKPRNISEIENCAIENDILDRIVFTGFISDDELEYLYSSAELLLFPSLYEGFGIPILEAFARELPVVCSTAASLPEVAGGAAVLVNPNNISEMASGVERVLNSIELRSELIAKAKLREQQFTWKNAAREMVRCYETVVHNNKKGAL